MSMTRAARDLKEGVITDRNMRETLVTHIEALDRAGKLLTMPKVNMATTKQVAEFFNVKERTIEKLYDRNHDELEADGAKHMSISGFKTTGCRFESLGQKGLTGLVLDDGSIYKVPTRGIRLFPKRAVLRIAMLLTGSDVAKAVRTTLLNLTEKVEEKAPAVVTELVQEQSDLLTSLAVAFTSGDIAKATESFLKLSAWQTGKLNEARAEIAELGEENQKLVSINNELSTANESLGTVNRMLIGEYAPLDPKKALMCIIRAVNRAEGRESTAVGHTYNEFYLNLELREDIHLNKRRIDGVTGRQYGKPASLIALIRETEWPKVMRCAAWFCSRYSVDPWYATNDATVEKYGLDKAEYDGKTYVNKKMIVRKFA